MNGRTHHQELTPEGRLAVVVRSLVLKLQEQHRMTGVGPREPDYSDFRDALRPYVRRELLFARIDEARKTAATALTSRMKELAVELLNCELEIPQEDRM